MSRYGYFDDRRREYVITRPDTPQPWTNYSGHRSYGAIYGNNATGYSFLRSPAGGRLLRFNYVAPQGSQPGRFFYLRDAADGDFWSASWLPVAKPLDAYACECRMGTGYVVIASRYRDIAAETTYFVPLGQTFEYWVLKLTNTGGSPRALDVFSYAEFTSVWDVHHEEFNQQYANAIAQCTWEEGMASGGNMVNLPHDPDFGERHQSRWWYAMQVGDAAVVAHDFERDAFLGARGCYAAPAAVVRGACGATDAYAGTACAAQQAKVELAPGETKTLLVLLGAGRAPTRGVEVRRAYGSAEAAERELARLKSYWNDRMGALRVSTPDPAFDSMINVWGIYNALLTFEWSRSCSFVYNGIDRDGFGYRDTVQDILGVLPAIPGEARKRLALMLMGQESGGGAQPVVDPVFFKPGAMPCTPLERQRADDCLWLFNTVPAYVAETGDRAFYDEVLPFADAGEGTVYEHLRRALEFSLKHRGAHGLACGLSADWNDCIKLGPRGESVFVSFQLRLGLQVFAGLARELGRGHDAAWADGQCRELDARIQQHTWDGAWFIRAITDRGDLFGSRLCAEGQIFLNPQSWAVISGAATPEQARAAMDSVERNLATDYGCRLHASSYRTISREVMHGVVYLPGTKENGAIFQHPQAWAVIADCLLGQGDRAYARFRAYLPAAQNDLADLRQVEPYAYAQWTHGTDSPLHGRSRVPWLSGTAAWSYHAATQYLLGIRPETDGLRIDPCIPAAWKAFDVERVFRGMKLHIKVRNPDGAQRGVRSLRIDGVERPGATLVHLRELHDGAAIDVTMGTPG